MKKNIHSYALLMLAALSSACTDVEHKQESEDSSTDFLVETEAFYDAMPKTRIIPTIDPSAGIGSTYITYAWETTDQIAVLYRRNETIKPNVFRLKRNTLNENASIATFQGVIDPSLMVNGELDDDIATPDLDESTDGEFYVGAVHHKSLVSRDPLSQNVIATTFDLSSQKTDGGFDVNDIVFLATSKYSIHQNGGELLDPFKFKQYSSMIELELTLENNLDEILGVQYETLEDTVLNVIVDAPNLSLKRSFNLTKLEPSMNAGSASALSLEIQNVKGKGSPESPIKAIIHLFPTTDNQALSILSFQVRTSYKDEVAIYELQLQNSNSNQIITPGCAYKIKAALQRQELILGDTEETPILIESADDLFELSNQVKDGDSKSGKYFKLTKDIDLSKFSSWQPIGNPQSPFMGHFDGNKKTIKSMTIQETDISSNNTIGLFGSVKSGYLKNLTVEGSINIDATTDAAGEVMIGGIVGHTIPDTNPCLITGNIISKVDIDYENQFKTSGNLYVGGVYGRLNVSENSVSDSTIIEYGAPDHTTSINVVAKNLPNLMIGGIVGSLANATLTTPTITTETFVTMINHANIKANQIITWEQSFNNYKNYTGGIIGEQTNMVNTIDWRAIVSEHCKYVHGIISPVDDNEADKTRALSVGGFVGYVNATKKFYKSVAEDVSTTTDIILEVSDEEAINQSKSVISVANPTYKLTVGSFAGGKGFVGGGNAQTENKIGGIGAAYMRDKNYFAIYPSFIDDVESISDNKTELSHSGVKIISFDSENFNAYPVMQ